MEVLEITLRFGLSLISVLATPYVTRFRSKATNHFMEMFFCRIQNVLGQVNSLGDEARPPQNACHMPLANPELLEVRQELALEPAPGAPVPVVVILSAIAIVIAWDCFVENVNLLHKVVVVALGGAGNQQMPLFFLQTQ